MAARSKTAIVAEVRKTVAPLHIDIISGEDAGAFNSSSRDSITPIVVFVKLLCILIEVLLNLRQNETNP